MSTSWWLLLRLMRPGRPTSSRSTQIFHWALRMHSSSQLPRSTARPTSPHSTTATSAWYAPPTYRPSPYCRDRFTSSTVSPRPHAELHGGLGLTDAVAGPVIRACQPHALGGPGVAGPPRVVSAGEDAAGDVDERGGQA